MITGPVILVDPDPDLGRRLLPVARRIFTETFGAVYEPSQFEAFCDAAYLPGGSMEQDLKNSKVRWRVATLDGEPIGYAKLTPLRAAVAGAAPGSMELQQIYVVSAWQGAGVADELMDWAIASAAEQNAPDLYLTVFVHNERAKRFYARKGFRHVGYCSFILGDQIDRDQVWRRGLKSTQCAV